MFQVGSIIYFKLTWILFLIFFVLYIYSYCILFHYHTHEELGPPSRLKENEGLPGPGPQCTAWLRAVSCDGWSAAETEWRSVFTCGSAPLPPPAHSRKTLSSGNFPLKGISVLQPERGLIIVITARAHRLAVAQGEMCAPAAERRLLGWRAAAGGECVPGAPPPCVGFPLRHVLRRRNRASATCISAQCSFRVDRSPQENEKNTLLIFSLLFIGFRRENCGVALMFSAAC